MEMSKQIRVAGLEAIHAFRLHRFAPRFLAGIGTILTFHHVRPARADGFQPNRNLEITPEFLDELLIAIRASDSEIVSLDEARRRLVERDFRRRFVVFSFDDGYRDIRDFAYPVLKRHGAPFTAFIASRFADGTGDLWWVVLERTVAAADVLETTIGARTYRFALRDDAARQNAFIRLYWALRALPDENEMRAIIQEMADRAGISTGTICRDLCMDWQEIASLAADPMVTVGAHTDTHIMLAKAPADQARADIQRSVERMQAELGIRPQHLCYPVGDHTSAGRRDFRIAEELGFRTALTTRRGALFPEHRGHLMALPRISVNGDFPALRYVETLLSGIPTAFANLFSRLDVA
jgi:peptidoglycan/xylan/chitin deacetylase (PgdA/CDA1 family)